MKTRTAKILVAIATLLLVMVMGISVAQALTPSEITGNASTEVSNSVKDIGGKVLGVLQVAGVVISVIILVVIGIKYMMGSAEEKAEYKKTMMPYIIGAIIIFAAPTIANVVYNFGTSINGRGTAQ